MTPICAAAAEAQPTFLLGANFITDTSDALAVCTTLLRLVDKLLGRYPTSLKDDAAALHRDRPMPHRCCSFWHVQSLC